MYIETSAVVDFDPSVSGLPLPPIGIYSNLVLKVTNTEEGQTKDKHRKFDITYEVLSGEITGAQFKLTYNVGHPKADTALWAVQDVLRIAYGITGDKEIHKRRGFNFDATMYNKPFNATLTVVAQEARDDNGNPYRSGKLTAIKPIEQAGMPTQPQYNGNAPVTTGNNNYYQPQQNTNAGQPQDGATPPWKTNQ